MFVQLKTVFRFEGRFQRKKTVSTTTSSTWTRKKKMLKRTSRKIKRERRRRRHPPPLLPQSHHHLTPHLSSKCGGVNDCLLICCMCLGKCGNVSAAALHTSTSFHRVKASRHLACEAEGKLDGTKRGGRSHVCFLAFKSVSVGATRCLPEALGGKCRLHGQRGSEEED